MRLFALSMLVLAACGPEIESSPPQTLKVLAFAKEGITSLQHPESSEYSIELSESALLVSNANQTEVETLSVLGHLALEKVALEAGTSAPVSLVTESCRGGCLCPQAPALWHQRNHVIFSDEVRERFGAQLNEIEVELCDTPTSRSWLDDVQALPQLEW